MTWTAAATLSTLAGGLGELCRAARGRRGPELLSRSKAVIQAHHAPDKANGWTAPDLYGMICSQCSQSKTIRSHSKWEHFSSIFINGDNGLGNFQGFVPSVPTFSEPHPEADQANPSRSGPAPRWPGAGGRASGTPPSGSFRRPFGCGTFQPRKSSSRAPFEKVDRLVNKGYSD